MPLSEIQKEIMRKGFEKNFKTWDSQCVMENRLLRSIMVDGYKQVIDDVFELQKETDLTLRDILGDDLCEGLLKAFKGQKNE